MAFSNIYRPQSNPLAFSTGEARHPIVIQKPDMTPGTMGSSITPDSWINVCSQNAAISTLTGRELMQASLLVSEVTHLVKMRWPGVAVKANYRVVFGTRIFTVKYVDNVQERNRVLLLYCLEVDGGGQ